MSGERQPIDVVLSCLKWTALLLFLICATINALTWRMPLPTRNFLLPVVIVVLSMGLFTPAVFFGHRLSGDGSPASFADLARNSPWWISALVLLLFANALACFLTFRGPSEGDHLLHAFSGVCAVFTFGSYAVYRAAQRLPADPTEPPRERKWWDTPMMRIGFWD